MHYTIDESVFSGKITFENILYGFRHDPILNNVSLEIMPNSITVITGKASSGKDGIANLLLKFNRQHEGNILIDNVNINMLFGSVGVFFGLVFDNLSYIHSYSNNLIVF